MIGLRPYMHPHTTLLTAAALALLYALLSIQVVRLRWGERLGMGLPTDPRSPLYRVARAHANFAEYVPFVLLLMLLLESTAAHPTTLRICGVVLVAGRIAHARGLIEIRTPNPWRSFGVAVTFGLLLFFAAWIFVRELL